MTPHPFTREKGHTIIEAAYLLANFFPESQNLSRSSQSKVCANFLNEKIALLEPKGFPKIKVQPYHQLKCKTRTLIKTHQGSKTRHVTYAQAYTREGSLVPNIVRDLES